LLAENVNDFGMRNGFGVIADRLANKSLPLPVPLLRKLVDALGKVIFIHCLPHQLTNNVNG
jgi:hypothetical protein